MTLSEIIFEKDSFVESMVEKHPDLKAMREELSSWRRDPRNKLLGTWHCHNLPSVEIDIRVEEGIFIMFISNEKYGDVQSSQHALYKSESERIYTFIYKGRIVEIIIFGDLDEDGEDNGPEMQIDGYNFYHVEGTCEFYQQHQAMSDDDEVGIAAMKYVENENTDED